MDDCAPCAAKGGRHPVADKLHRNLERECGGEMADRVAYGVDLAADAPPEDKAAWVRHVVAELEGRLPEGARRDVMMGCHCDEICKLDDMKEWLGGLYRGSATMEEFVEKVNRHGAGWYIEDGSLYTKYLWCECHMLGAVESLPSLTWCHCTEGYAKALFEHVFGREVESELLRSIKTGAECCLIRIAL